MGPLGVAPPYSFRWMREKLCGSHDRRFASGVRARGAGAGPARARGDGLAPPERRLVRGVQRGDAAALEELFRREWPRAYRAAYLVVHDAAAAEDIAQEAFLAAVRAIDRFDRRRPFGPWMHRIVVNRAIDVTRALAAAGGGRVRRGDRRGAPGPPSTPLSDDLVAALGGLTPSTAPSSCSATCSTTRPARSRRPSTCRAARSTRAFGALDHLGEVIER